MVSSEEGANISGMMNILRDHEAGICLHRGFRTTASMVSLLTDQGNNRHWFTGTAYPCQSASKLFTFNPVESGFNAGSEVDMEKLL